MPAEGRAPRSINAWLPKARNRSNDSNAWIHMRGVGCFDRWPPHAVDGCEGGLDGRRGAPHPTSTSSCPFPLLNHHNPICQSPRTNSSPPSRRHVDRGRGGAPAQHRGESLFAGLEWAHCLDGGGFEGPAACILVRIETQRAGVVCACAARSAPPHWGDASIESTIPSPQHPSTRTNLTPFHPTP